MPSLTKKPPRALKAYAAELLERADAIERKDED
jgi:hypothetical protein